VIDHRKNCATWTGGARMVTSASSQRQYAGWGIWRTEPGKPARRRV